MPRRRPRGVAKRMDAAIDHFTPMGYRKADVRSVVNKLLKVYGKVSSPLPPFSPRIVSSTDSGADAN